MPDIVPFTVPIVFLLLGLYLVLSSARDLYFGARSYLWPTTTGVVIAVRVHAGSIARHDSTTIVRYRYEIDGVLYESERFDFAGRNAGKEAGDVMHRAQVGKSVDVHYDPRKPSRAVLACGFSEWTVGPILLGGMLVLVALLWFGWMPSA